MKGQITKEVKPFTKEQAALLAKNYNMGASSIDAAKKEQAQELKPKRNKKI